MNRENPIRKTVGSREADFLPVVPLVEIYGRQGVVIENHQGIIGYSSNEILVKTRCGHMCVRGDCLKLTKMSKEKLVIAGKIYSVNLQGREQHGNV